MFDCVCKIKLIESVPHCDEDGCVDTWFVNAKVTMTLGDKNHTVVVEQRRTHNDNQGGFDLKTIEEWDKEEIKQLVLTEDFKRTITFQSEVLDTI